MPDPKPSRPKAQRLPSNPGPGEAFDALKAEDGPHFVLAHNVGPFHPGDVVSARDLGPHAELQRLVDLGAMSRASEDQVDAYLDGVPDEEPAPAPAPPVQSPNPPGPKFDAPKK